MTNKADEHQRLILEQFTKQAVPFSQMQNHSPELLLAASGVEAADKVLDVACGPGLMACAFARVALHVTGIDLTPAMIEQAKVMQQADRLTNLTWHIGDVQPLPFADASYSLVFTRYSFHHFLDPRAVLAEMVRVCTAGGRLVVVDVFTSRPEQAEAYNRMEKLRDPSHVRALALEELMGLVIQAELRDVRTHLYKHEVELEQVLQRSFPNPGDADTIRRIFAEDLDANRLGVNAHRRDGIIYYAYPVAVVVGQK
jgi:ubiquinone/menaquinone biosynthesis C-methylase UbiE